MDPHAAIATAAFAAAHAASSMNFPASARADARWVVPPTPQPLQYYAHHPTQPFAQQHIARPQAEIAHMPHEAISDARAAVRNNEAAETGQGMGELEGTPKLDVHFQLLLRQHAAELEARRRVEEEMQALRRQHDELQARHQELVSTCHKAEIEKSVAVANAKAAEKAAKEREASIERLEQQVSLVASFVLE
ncbi:hypothetical protein AB1Y20_007707 [Prymnesium parvum]|uniref:Uncharacterized protein n=1 Tax=Prymnesium parvum TaxID=97485 RepID=A0AB34IZN5_PRYPA